MILRIPGVLLILFLLNGSALPQNATRQEEVKLLHIASRVFKIPDVNKFETESWTITVVVQDAQKRGWQPVRSTIDLSAGGKVIKSMTFDQQMLESMKFQQFLITDQTAKASPRRLFSIADEVFDLQFYFTERIKASIDKTKITLQIRDSKGVTAERTLEIPIEVYRQKTKLIFPFRGPGIVTQGHFNNGGHSHKNTLFAIDVMALTDVYAPMLSIEEKNETIAGWGREILATADGKVTYARNDVPTNQRMGDPDVAAYSALPEPTWAIGGNSVVIDHGNGEFSVFMHMQQGSVTVKKGDTVKQGQVIGKLGNSGDSYMPHLHYHLQDGPVIFASDGLPVEFVNLPDTRLVRGNYFEAK